MKVLLIKENGRHDANRKYGECFALQSCFVKLGHECEIWGLGHENFESQPDWESYDWIINLENYDQRGWIPSLSNVKKPKKFLWSIDAHCRGEAVFEHTFREGNYDVLLHATKDYVKQDYHLWFPNAVHDELIKPMNLEKEYDFGFCGNYVNRKPVLEFLEREHNLHLDIFVIGDAMVEAINKYKCHFNLNISNDINFRSFETIGCGTLLLTNYNPQYEELGFIDGENCFMYTDPNSLIEKIDYIKNNDISEIAKNGYELSTKNTYLDRVKMLLETV
jgi:hypothetical protein